MAAIIFKPQIDIYSDEHEQLREDLLNVYDLNFEDYEVRSTRIKYVFKIINKKNKLSYSCSIIDFRDRNILEYRIVDKEYWKNTYRGIDNYKNRHLDSMYTVMLYKEIQKMFDYFNIFYQDDPLKYLSPEEREEIEKVPPVPF